MLTVGSLFTGIGGLDLGFERAGMTVVWQSEIDPYCCAVLAKHWPNVPNLGDVRDIDWQTVERPDVICGGYPCQPFSLAGKRQGTEDPRHLWPQYADAIRTLRPRYAVLENVYGHLSKGFGEVVAELSSIGYDVEWDCVPAAAVGAPHLRDRLFAIATPNGGDAADPDCGDAPERGQRALVSQSGIGWRDDRSGSGCIVREVGVCCAGEDSRNVSDANSERCKEHSRPFTIQAEQFAVECGGSNVADAEIERIGAGLFARISPPEWGRRPRNGSSPSDTWIVEPDVGRVAHGIPARVDRLRALGNAVVPQVAQYIGELIVSHAGEA